MPEIENYGFDVPEEPDEEYARLFDVATETPKEEPEPKEDYKALFDRQKEEFESLRTEFERTKQQQAAYTAPPVNQHQGAFAGAPQQSVAQMFDQIVVERGIGGAFEALAQLSAKQAADAAKQNLFPVAAQTAQYAISQYKASNNFQSEDHRAEFEKIVNKFTAEELAAVDPRQISQRLAEIDSYALGEAVKRGRSTRNNNPPAYSIGSSAGSSGTAGKGFAGRRLSNEERAVFQAGQDAKLPDAEIASIIREMREGADS